MILTQQPVPKGIEDLRQEVCEDTLLTRLEQALALQDEAIRTYKADTLIVGAPQPSSSESEQDEDDDEASVPPEASVEGSLIDADDDEYEEEEDEMQ